MDVVKLWIETMALERPYIFQQDGDRLIQVMIQKWLSDNIDMFWSKEFWSLNSSDLNPVDYIWIVVERVTNKSRHPNVTSLKITIEAAFVGMNSATL